MNKKADNLISDLTIAETCLCSKLRASSRQISRTYDHALKSVGLNSNQLNVLVGINIMSPVSITRLSEQLSMERTTLTRNLKPLEKSGYVVLTQGYGRTKELALTEEGKAILDQAKPLWEKAQHYITTQIGLNQSEHVDQLLQEILKIEIPS